MSEDFLSKNQQSTPSAEGSDTSTNQQGQDTVIDPAQTAPQGQSASNTTQQSGILENGLSDLNRDAFLNLCKLLWYKTNEIKALIGMCVEHYIWSKHRHFINNRPINISASPMEIPNCVCKATSSGFSCSFNHVNSNRDKTIFLNNEIREGVYRWTISNKYALLSPTYFFLLGVAGSDKLKSLKNGFLLGGASFMFGKYKAASSDAMELRSDLFGVEKLEGETTTGNIFVPDGSMVSVEVDMKSHILSFFVKDVKVPGIISGITGPLHFGYGLRMHFLSPPSFAHNLRCGLQIVQGKMDELIPYLFS